MKLFWKIFYSTMIVSVSCFSIGSYILIDSAFQDSIKREATSVFEENDILRYSLQKELREASVSDFYFADEKNKESISNEELLITVASSLTIYESGGELTFRISNQDGHVVYDNFNEDLSNDAVTQVSNQSKGYQVKNVNGKYFLHAMTPLQLHEDLFYIENFREISDIFASKNDQWTMYMYITLLMIGIGAIVMLVTAWLLTKPIYKLSKATKQITKGNFEERTSVSSYVEVEELSRNFNFMAEHIEEMISQLKEANQRQETFIGSISHELKTPLTTMIGYADMLRSKKLDSEQTFMAANYIFQEGKRIEELTMKLLDLLVLKKRDIETKPIKATAFFSPLQQYMEPIFEKENMDFHVEAEEAMIPIEPDLMRTVCTNLLDNARKAIDHDHGEIMLHGFIHQNDYHIRICDNGKGIQTDEMAKITDAFYMVDKSRARVQGSVGLGLAICSEIIHLHKAELTFDSEFGEGTCVTVMIKGVKR
ncbi:sensor histidine kinase [Virgibacillus dokdonensis]|uniref:sensor histidine kinase n=1 Tax=Virgibacillus dokdonensis TaxID=302167 RepID=UPI00098AD0F7|nr:HAMP domain-containing sensor histidine kinase [Virgibacillus dokdonensis]